MSLNLYYAFYAYAFFFYDFCQHEIKHSNGRRKYIGVILSVEHTLLLCASRLRQHTFKEKEQNDFGIHFEKSGKKKSFPFKNLFLYLSS